MLSGDVRCRLCYDWDEISRREKNWENSYYSTLWANWKFSLGDEDWVVLMQYSSINGITPQSSTSNQRRPLSAQWISTSRMICEVLFFIFHQSMVLSEQADWQLVLVHYGTVGKSCWESVCLRCLHLISPLCLVTSESWGSCKMAPSSSSTALGRSPSLDFRRPSSNALGQSL